MLGPGVLRLQGYSSWEDSLRALPVGAHPPQLRNCAEVWGTLPREGVPLVTVVLFPGLSISRQLRLIHQMPQSGDCVEWYRGLGASRLPLSYALPSSL